MKKVPMSEKSIYEKLQLKSGRSLLILNPPPDFLKRAGVIPENTKILLERGPATIVQVFIHTMDEFMSILDEVDALLQPGGIFWVAYPKLTSKIKGDINRDTINSAAQERGWTGVAIIAIDEDWSALRLKRT